MTPQAPPAGTAERTSPQPAPAHRAPAASYADDIFLTVAEVARIMRVSPMTVYRLILDGDLDAIRIGRRTSRVSGSAVTCYLRGARMPPPGQEP